MCDEEAVLIQCGRDRMVGVVHHAPAGSNLALIMVVGGPQYRVGSHRMYVKIARGLASLGLPVLRFDLRGMGDSTGEFESFEQCSSDLNAAVDYALTHFADRVALFGLCDGAAAVAMYLAEDLRVAGACLLNPWVRSSTGEARARTRHYYPRRLRQKEFWVQLVLGRKRVFASARSFIVDLVASLTRPTPMGFVDGMRVGLSQARCPVQVLLSASDLTAQEFEGLVRTDRRWTELIKKREIAIVSMEGADHTLSDTLHLSMAIRHLSRFLDEACGASIHKNASPAAAPKTVERQ